jgi:HlyD family secretion protein
MSKAPIRQTSSGREKQSPEHLLAGTLVEAAELTLRKEQLLLEKTRLRAPIDGTIVECTLQPGQLTGPAESIACLRIVNRSKTRVRAWVEELDAMDVSPGMQALVIAAGSVERRYRGNVISCASYVEPKSQRHLNPGERVDVRVREIVVELKDGSDLLLGLPVELFIAPDTDEKSDTTTTAPDVRRRERREQDKPGSGA